MAKPPRQAPSNKEFPTAISSPQYLLPKDLSNGIKLLTDQEFDRLLAAVLTEQKRRGKRAPMRSRSVASSVGLILTHSEPSDCLFRSRLDPIP
jgi:hypothetical protein